MKKVFWSLVMGLFLLEGAFAWNGKPEKIIQLAYRTGANASATKHKVKHPRKRRKKKAKTGGSQPAASKP